MLRELRRVQPNVSLAWRNRQLPLKVAEARGRFWRACAGRGWNDGGR